MSAVDIVNAIMIFIIFCVIFFSIGLFFYLKKGYEDRLSQTFILFGLDPKVKTKINF